MTWTARYDAIPGSTESKKPHKSAVVNVLVIELLKFEIYLGFGACNLEFYYPVDWGCYYIMKSSDGMYLSYYFDTFRLPINH